MTSTKVKLQEIKEKLAANPNLSLSEIKGLSEEWAKLFSTLQDKNKKEERILANEVAEKINEAVFNSIDRWEKGQVDPSEAEVVFLYEFFLLNKHYEANWTAVEKSLNENKEIDEDEKQQIIKSVKKSIEKLKKYEPILKKLFQEADKKFYPQKKKKKDDSNEEENTEQILNQKITELQDKIDELKKNQDNTNPQIQQQITALQKQKEEIQDKLQNRVSSSSSTPTDSPETRENKKGKGFPFWGIILIFFAVLALLGTIGYLVLEKKEKSKPGKTKNE